MPVSCAVCLGRLAAAEPVPFRQFEVEAKELELKRLLAEGEGQDKAADEVMCTCRCRRVGVTNIIFASE